MLDFTKSDLDSRLSGLFTHEGIVKLRSWGLWEHVGKESLADLVEENVMLDPSVVAQFESQLRAEVASLQARNQSVPAPELLAVEFQKRLRKEKLRFFKQQRWGDSLPKLFLQHRNHLERVVYSLIRVLDADLAREIYCRIQEGEQTFADAAREFSDGADALTGGLQGPMPLSSPHPDLARLLQSAEPGQLLPPNRVAQWHVILRLEKRLPAQLDEATANWLLDRAYEEWAQSFVFPAPPSTSA
jgi:parvulin-like peptidyl-prolyl isomerase